MDKYIVYKHTNLLNNKTYIGITKHGDNPNYRWKNGRGYEYNDKFFADILKYGWSNFSHEILETELNAAEAVAREKYYIQLFDSVKCGYNITAGGCIPSEEGVENIRNALTGIKRKPESIAKQMQTKYQRYGNGRGIKYLGSVAQKVRCKETNDVFASFSEAGRWSGSTKISLCCQGKRQHAGHHPETGQPLSWEYVDDDAIVTKECNEQLIKKTYIKKIQCIETNNIYNNASEASRNTGVSMCNILRVCKGERKTAGKLHWKFIEEN